MELIDDGGLADTGISRNEHQLRPAAGYDAIEGGEQGLDLACTPVQFLGDHQPVRRVVLTKREFVDAAPRFPFSKTAPKVSLDAGRCLVALLSSLSEQLHDDYRNRTRDAFQPLGGRHRLSCNVAVYPLHRIGSRERKTAGQHFVECDPE